MARASFNVQERRMALGPHMKPRPLPIEPDLNSVGGGVSLLAPSPGLTEPFCDLQTPGGHRTPQSADDLMGPPRQRHLWGWGAASEPWNPIVGRNGAPSRHGARLVNSYTHGGEPLPAHRSHAPSDSGYGTMSRTGHSVANGSVYGECDQSGETASVASHSAAGFPSNRSMPPSEHWAVSAGSVLDADAPAKAGDSKSFFCHHCKSELRTKSELKKHTQRHEKPYRCRVAGCSRDQGFSTPNDVERHMKSRHPELYPGGKYYRCSVPECRSRGKNWPRADNFRQHLKRVHHMPVTDEQLKKYEYKPLPSPGPDLALAGMGSSVRNADLPTDIHHNGDILGSNSWALGLHTVQEEASRDPSTFNHYIHQQIDQQMFQDAVVTRHQLEVLRVTRASGHNSNTMMPMQPVAYDVDTTLSHLGERAIELEDGSDLSGPLDGHHSISLHSSFLGGAPMPDDKSVVEDDQSDAQGMADLASPAVQGGLPAGFAIGQTIDAWTGDLQEDPVGAEDDESSRASMSPDSSSGSENSPTSQDATASQAGQSRASGSSPDDPNTSNKDKTTGLLKALEDKGTLAEILGRLDKATLAEALGRLGYEKPREAETEPEAKNPADANNNNNKSTIVCTHAGCNKTFARRCELRKHLKRHAKPYRCTFPRCNKSFGSKNDWMRHENSQHYQLELWKCSERSLAGAGEACGRTYNRREQFKTHLLRDHDIASAADVEAKLQSCLDPRNYEVSFWCGFCEKMVKVKEKGLKAWVGRVNHIDQHFAEDLDMSQWKSMEPGGSEGNVALKEIDAASTDRPAEPPAPSPAQADGGGGRSLKRRADGETQQQPRPQKRARASAVWYCCDCGEQYLKSFSSVCLDPSCGHEQCDNCSIDVALVDPEL